MKKMSISKLVLTFKNDLPALIKTKNDYLKKS